MQLRSLILTIAMLLLVAGCTGPGISPEERSVLERPARALESRGQWREAATAWQQASQTVKGDLAVELQLNAADALLQSGDGLGAAQLARALPESIAPAQSIRRALVLADASVQTGDPMDALQRVGPGLTSNDPNVISRYRRIRADALEMTGDAWGASRERSLRDPLLADIESRYRNRQRIWELLGQVPLEQLEAQLPDPSSAHSGWVDLAVVARRNALDVDQLQSAVSDWTIRFPGHPAGEQIVPEIIELARAESQPPGKVAVMLPQSGPFAEVSAAIRDGFMAAWYADAPNEHRPEIVLVDTHGQDVALAYSDAITGGAQFVIGPLSKDSVSAVVNGTGLDVTTLALNYPLVEPATEVQTTDQDALPTSNDAPGTEPGTATQAVPTSDNAAIAAAQVDAQAAGTVNDPTAEIEAQSMPSERDLQRVYYFVLSPEDEARRAAEYAWSRGARQAAVLAAAGTWGERVGDAFAQRWEELGGTLAKRAAFPEEAQGLSEAVEQLLNIGASKARAKRLRAVLVRDIKHEPNPRSDLDVIFMAAFPQAARQLRPLLRFHRADRVPVVATSHVFAGVSDAQADQDLNGLIFADMPWLLTPNAHSLPSQARQLWPQSGGALGRLYAFGADAYALIARLRELRLTPGASFPGLTGDLSLDSQRRVRRDMRWAVFVEGLVQPVDNSEETSTWAIAGQ